MNRWIQKVVFAALLPLVVMGEEPGFLSKPLVPDDAVVIADFDVWAPDGAPYEGWAAGTVSAGSAETPGMSQRTRMVFSFS
ncbi:MAG: hypothetical protein H8E68_08205 [Kiritimatiellaeota bacterium]|nr:hypothetical protein [Kiritimatiellota bacterium]